MLLEASSQPSLSGDKRHGALYLCTHIVGLEFLSKRLNLFAKPCV